ncbi:cation-dependent mannose-6-phosphate receptor-like [Brachionus plicatilis]|uniref:Cation-dependent mannose-6-phosphate receptor-like n=1 Tax=Brachionus plicatilis TaxID=10195 RepID=A0A3M7PET8_BRAPC|nr:cation-dependent mannose-6-phosphate receptor-like [Brachionus plicatilis]
MRPINLIFGYFGPFFEKSRCKITLPNNNIMDITPLDNPAEPMTCPDIVGDYKFFYNPCTPIPCNQTKTSAICQKSLDNKYEFNIGILATLTLSYNNSLLIHFNGNDNRITTINCECSEREKDLTFVKEDPLKIYVFELNSKWCCPRDEKKGLSFGSLILILFFSVFTSYLVFGFIFLKYFKKKTGNETIPNYDFWSLMGRNIKEGMSFTLSKIKGDSSAYDKI